MAFGMQKEVYKRRPRKPFSKRRKTSYDTIPKYKREFKSQPSNYKSHEHFGIVIFIIIVFILSSMLPRWLDYAREKHRKEITHTTVKHNTAYNFLTKSGISRMKSQNYIGALSEFKLAQKIRPDSPEINRLLLEVISILCEKDEKHCKDFEILEF